MKKSIISTILASTLLASTLSAYGLFDVDINEQINYNEMMIQKYEKAIEKLKKETKYLKDEKAKNPELFVKKPLFENLADKYIYRIKLNGAKAENLSFMIKDGTVSVTMDMKSEHKSDNSYYYNSQYFSTSYTIPNDVKQDKITHKVEGDYFTIIMPKKK